MIRIIKAAVGTAALAGLIGSSLLTASAEASTGGPAAAMVASTAARETAPAATPNGEHWEYGGKYPTLYDCNQAGFEAENAGALQSRCDEVTAPDGTIEYYNMYFLVLD